MSDNKGHILVVDDDTRLRALLKQFLEKEGYTVDAAEHTVEARAKMALTKYDLMVLDVLLPGQTGVEFAAEIRSRERDPIPILMLTALGEVDNRIKGLESGVDDYMVKPFEPKELSLRVDSILRRAGSIKHRGPVRFGPYVFNRENGTLYRQGAFVTLTSTELKLMMIFTDSINKAISRETLSRLLNNISERSVDVQVTRLRRKLEDDPKKPQFLQTDWGAGYVLRDRPE
ncbi:MAG: DNA-binding response regulator [Proteobacteria bacterium]|nr:DNA-binding response regulator [Pseudomonadota bacterium]